MMKSKVSAVIEESTMNIEQENTKKKTQLGDLPEEIVRLIMQKLGWSERRHLCFVCKSWYKCLPEVENTQEFLPWIMSYELYQIRGYSNICKLRDPFTKRSYRVKDAAILVKNREFVGGTPCASRHGWVLFSKMKYFGFDFISLFFLYNPFTNEVIKFPQLEKEYRLATFSLSPSSSDCMVFTLKTVKSSLLCIKTCRPGDESWKKFIYPGEYLLNSRSEVAYAGEFFYCAFSDGKLGAFNIKQKTWEVLSQQLPLQLDCNFTLSDAFDECLLLTIAYHYRWKAWRFDLSENEWVVVEDEILKKLVMFGGVISFSVPAVGNAEEYAGKSLPMSLICFLRSWWNSRKWWNASFNKQRIWIQPPPFPKILRACDLLQSSRMIKNQALKSK